MGINVSEERRKLAKNQIQLLDALYKSVTDDGFNTEIDLKDFKTSHLKDFWVYTSGFLCLNKYEKYDFSQQEIGDIFNGEFVLLELDRKKREELLNAYGKKLSPKGYSFIIPLETIQDGKFTIKIRCGRHTNPAGVLALDTQQPTFESEHASYLTDSEKIAIVRNTFAHNTPFISGNTLLFRRFDGNLYVSKMWLRGLTETYANKYAVFNYEFAKMHLTDTLAKQANYILNNQDIDKALTTMRDFFDPVARDNFYRINTLIKARIQYIPDFFNLSFDKKTDILASLCANNQVYFETVKGTSNPAIIYTLQKLVAKELENRQESAILTDEELEDCKEKITNLQQKLETYAKEFEKINEKVNKNKNSIPMLNILRKENERLAKEFYFVHHQFEVESNKFFNMIKLESSNMDTMNVDQLAGSSLEVAFNIMCLMGFNQLVTSAFYDDLLVKTDFNDLNIDQKKFFNSFDLSKLSLNGRPIENTATTKAYILLCMREALCHQNFDEGYGVYYSVPGLKQNEKKSFKDIKVTFKAARQNAEISGSLDDFYKLFVSESFLKERKEKILTGNVEIIDNDDVEDDSEQVGGEKLADKSSCGNSNNDDAEELE